MITDGTLTMYSPEWWAAELSTVDKELDDKWRDSADKIISRFLDNREDDSLGDSARKYNIFWANTQILKSALYATPPKPAVKRQHDDAKDDVARCAALILQRILSFGLEIQNSDMHTAFQQATDDRLIPGMGQVWLRYDVETEPVSLPAVIGLDGMEIAPAFEGERIVNQEVYTDFVNWRDFLWSPARTWEEVTWVARRTWLKKKAFTKRFGADKYKEIRDSAKNGVGEHGYPKGFEKGRVEVFEVWCEDTNKVYMIHCGTKSELEPPKDDPLKLEGFWPCPKPVFATHTTNSLIPRPDYVMVQDQYAELDILNDRINTLTKALRVVGAYDGSNTSLAKMLTGPEFAMIPVDKWAALAESGGIKGVIDWFPVEQIAAVLSQLMEQRTALVQQIYELTGISDIMRGGSNPRETLGAQKLKAQYSSVRLRLVQQAIAEFVCEALRIKAEIISKHFDPAQIKAKSQIELTESAMMADPAIELLKNYSASQYRIEISEESLSMADYTAEREMRVAYLTSVGQFLSQASTLVQGMPQALPYIIKMVQWVTASFRGSDDIETVLDEAAKSASANPPKTPEEKPDKSLEVAQLKAKTDAENNQRDNSTRLTIAREQIKKDLDIAREEIGVKKDATQNSFDLEVLRVDSAGEEKQQSAQQDIAKQIKEAIDQLAGALMEKIEANLELKEVMAKMTQPRRKIPKYDADGNITQVDEVPLNDSEE